MTYPDIITLHPDRIDKNASGWYISGEYFNIPSSSPYQMYLDHIPKDAATTEVWASGGLEWTEDFTGTPVAGEFYVEYDVGRITFNSANAGAALEARYDTLGDDIMAEHVNNMQDEVYAIELELGQGIPGVYTDLAERLDTFMTIGSAISASQVSIITPPGMSSTTVQEFINASGTANRSDTNPFGIGWQDIYDADGDMVRAQNNITTGYFYANTVAASGNQIGINVDGPDEDQWMYFYDNSSPLGQWMKWDDGNDRFEFSGGLYIHGGITASGVITATMGVTPAASGTGDLGSAAVRFDNGYFNNVDIAQDSLTIGPSSTISGPSGIMTFNDAETGVKTLADLSYSEWIGSGGYLKPNTDGDSIRTYDSSGTDYVEFSHSGSDAFLKWNVDSLFLTKATGGSSLVSVTIQGESGGGAEFDVRDSSSANYWIRLAQYNSIGYINVGSSTTNLILNGNNETCSTTIRSDTLDAFKVEGSTGITTFGNDLLPAASGSQDMGTVALAFNDAYIDKVYLEGSPTLPLQAATKQYVDAQVAGVNEFTELTDTPGSYTNMAASGVRVNPGADALEFYDATASRSGHVHNQTVASSVWVITHNLNNTNVIVQCTDGASPESVVTPDSIELTDADTTTVTFVSAQSGVARIISLVLA